MNNYERTEPMIFNKNTENQFQRNKDVVTHIPKAYETITFLFHSRFRGDCTVEQKRQINLADILQQN